ncbi:MAG: hypothetical protein JW726_09360 [Anaerolineales bacterium]|nr:hypothetical protein [Anaerolineales bacterium]
MDEQESDTQTTLVQQGDAFIVHFLAGSISEREALRAEGVEMANRIRWEAIDLAYSKATEFSSKIILYHLLAAKIALLAHWPDRESLAPFEQDIRYYESYQSTLSMAKEYEQFRIAFTGKGAGAPD